MNPTRLWSLMICTASACAPITDNRLYDEESAGFRSALVLPLNVIASLPDDLAPGSGRVEDALHDYLRDHGKRVRDDYLRRGAQCLARECRRLPPRAGRLRRLRGAGALSARSGLAQGHEYDLLIVPYLRFRAAENCAEHVHWDQVERPVEKVGPGLYRAGSRSTTPR